MLGFTATTRSGATITVTHAPLVNIAGRWNISGAINDGPLVATRAEIKRVVWRKAEQAGDPVTAIHDPAADLTNGRG